MVQKIAMLFCFFLLIGCNNDSSDSNTGTATGPLPKKITETIYSSAGNDVSVGNFNYEDGLLKSISSGDNLAEYIYQGDKIVKINYYRGNTLRSVNNIAYNGNDIFEIVRGDNSEKTQFQHQNGVLQSKREYLNDSGSWVAANKSVYTVNASNITTEIYTDLIYSPGQSSRKEFFFDTSKSPFKNLNPYFKYLFVFETFDSFNVNNVVLREDYETLTATTPVSSRVFQIVYNDDGYPVEIKKIIPSNNMLISKVIIEYM